MRKWSCILLMVATLFVLVTGDCIQEAKDSLTPGLLIGRYHPIKNPEKNAVVKKIVADSIKLYDKGSPIGFSYVDDDHYLAFRRIPPGSERSYEKYCCQFQMKGRVCNNGDKSGNCLPEKRVCTVGALKKMPATFATIFKGSLNCTVPKAVLGNTTA